MIFKMRSKLLFAAAFLWTSSVFAQSEQRMQEIATSAAALMQEAAVAAKAEDGYKACTKSKEGVLLWYEIDPRAVPSKNIQDFFATDVKVRNMVKVWMNICGKY